MHGFHTADEGWCWTNGASNISALDYCSRSALHDLQSGALFVRLLFTQCHACLFLFSLLFCSVCQFMQTSNFNSYWGMPLLAL
jgi:hypothetical protein